MSIKVLIRLGLMILFLIVFYPSFKGSASNKSILSLDSPGTGSSVRSPILLSAQIGTQEHSLIRVTLVDRSGAVISRKLHRPDEETLLSSTFSTEITFEIPRETVEGLLSIAILDSTNRPIAQRSAEVLLLAGGQAQVTASQQADWLMITHPQPGDILEGGEVQVMGTISPLIESPIFFELLTDSGGQIGSRQLPVPSVGDAFSFDISIPYAFITDRRDVRLVIRQRDAKFGQTLILDSVPIFLSP